MPLIPILAALACPWLMLNLSVQTWLRFVIWTAIGVVLYFAYGRSHSVLAERGPATDGVEVSQCLRV